MKKLSLYLLISVAIWLPIDAAQASRTAHKKGNHFKPAATTPWSQNSLIDHEPSAADAFKGASGVKEASQLEQARIGILPGEYEGIKDGHLAFNTVFTKVDEALKAFGHKEPSRHNYNHFSIPQLQVFAQSQITLIQKAQELASAEKADSGYFKPAYNATEASLLGLKKALHHVQRADYIEPMPTDKIFHSEDGLSHFEMHLLKDIPAGPKGEVGKVLTLELGRAKTLSESELKNLAEKTAIPKEIVLQAYRSNPVLKPFYFSESTVLPQEAHALATHLAGNAAHNGFKASLRQIKTSQTEHDAIKFHGACFYKDEVSGDIISMTQTSANPDSQEFKAAHSQAMGPVGGNKGSLIENLTSLKKSFQADFAMIKTHISATTLAIKELEESNPYENRNQIISLKELLAEYQRDYATLMTLTERGFLDREIQARAYEQLKLNSGSTSGKPSGWYRALTALVLRPNAQVPHQVWVSTILAVAAEQYEQDKARYDSITTKVDEKTATIAAFVAKSNEEKAAIAKTAIMTTVLRHPLLKKNTAQNTLRNGCRTSNQPRCMQSGPHQKECLKSDLYEFPTNNADGTQRTYATTQESWKLQEPSMSKILKRLLPKADYELWLEQDGQKKVAEAESERKAQEVARAEKVAAELKAASKPAAKA